MTAKPSQTGRKRADILHELRRLLPRTEVPGPARVLPFGLPEIDARLPGGGLACAAVHEIVPAEAADDIAALGFVVALLARLPRGGPVVFVATAKQELRFLHGHGLNSLGLDPARIILVEAGDERQALWAMEEALRSRVPAAVAGVVGEKLDLLAGQRLHLATGDTAVPLLLLRPPGLPGINVAATRWRLRARDSRRDRFGLCTHWRWQAQLLRCRNGRSGEWVLEYDHAAYRFSLPAALAGPALSRRAETERGARSRAVGGRS